jgi:hypothetical protein
VTAAATCSGSRWEGGEGKVCKEMEGHHEKNGNEEEGGGNVKENKVMKDEEQKGKLRKVEGSIR